MNRRSILLGHLFSTSMGSILFNFYFFDLYLLLNTYFLNGAQNKYYYGKCIEDELCMHKSNFS